MDNNLQIKQKIFDGNIFIFYSFDVGDDIDLEAVKNSQALIRRPLTLSKYFKNYHIPLEVELPHPHNKNSSRCISAKLYNFGVITLTYKIPYEKTLEKLREEINTIEEDFREQSVSDAASIFSKIKQFVKQARFFHLRNSYLVIQADIDAQISDTVRLKEEYGGLIASILRFETELLSEYQKNDILDSAIGYYRGDLIIIDTEAAFVYDDEYLELLDLFEFATLQQLELQYFDRVLDQQLNEVYEQDKVRTVTLKTYLPLISLLNKDPIAELGKLRVDISVITERLENSIKLVGEAYYSEVYALLVSKLEIDNWRESINRKLDIVKDIRTIFENNVNIVREDLLSVLIIILIFIEVIIGILHYLK